MRKLRKLLCLLVFFSASDDLCATTYYVNKAGSDGNSCATAQSPTDANGKLTIGSALSCTTTGQADEVIVGDGVYSESLLNTIKSGASSGSKMHLHAENALAATIRAPSGSRVITLTSKNFIKISGFNIDGVNLSGSGVVIDLTDSGTLCTYIEFGDNVIENSLDSLIFASGDNFWFHGNVMRHTVGAGALQQDHLLYSGNVTNMLVEDNTFSDAPGYGIHNYYEPWASANNRASTSTIRRNTFFNCRSGMAIISTANGSTFYNNVGYDNGESADGWGGVRTQQSNNVKIWNNTFHSNGTGFSGTAAIQITGTGSFQATGVVVQNNVMWQNNATILGCSGPNCSQSFNHTSDPSFTNAGTRDYTLQASSTAIGAGTDLSAQFTTDRAGTTRTVPFDIGAYEFTGGASITLLVPNGGQSLQIGTSQTVTWSSSGLSGTGIDINEDRDGNGSYETVIVDATTDDGTHGYTVGGSANANRKMQVCDADGSPCDVSDAVYAAASSSPGSITVTFPVSGTHVFPGQTIPVQWTSQNISGNVRIHAFHDGVELIVSSSYRFDGTDFVWTIPAGSSASSNWYFEVTSLNDLNVFDASDTFRVGGSYLRIK